MAAGNNLEQSVALVASANKVVQDPSSVGSALRTISLRLRGTSVEVLEEMGEETEGVVESVSKMQEKIKALTGVDILTDSGAYKETYAILYEIGQVWDDMSDIDAAALLELMAGKNRANTLAAILDNMKDLEGAYKDALNAEGSALKENAAYLDSIQGRIDLFNNSVQTMWMNFIDDDVIKFLVDVGSLLIKIVDFINPLNVAVAGLFGGMFAKYKMKKSNTDIFSLLFETTPTKIKNSPVIQNFASTFKTAYNDVLKNVIGTASVSDIFAEFGNHDYGTDLIADATAQWGLNDANIASIPIMKEQVKVLLQKKVAEGAVNQETAEAILNNITFTATEGAATVATNGFTLALSKLWASIVGTAKALWGFVTAHPYLIAFAVAISTIVVAFNALSKAHEKQIEKLNEETEALKSVQSELEAVQSELKKTADSIDELEAKGTLSFVEEEELKRLKEQTAELERQEAILLAQEKRARNKQAETAARAVTSDPDLNGLDWKSVLAYGALNAQTEGLSVDSGINMFSTNKFEENLEKLANAKEELAQLEAQLNTISYKPESKEYKNLENKVNEAKANVEKYNNAIDELSATFQTKYGEVGYIEDATTKWEKRYNDIYRQHQNYIAQQSFINGTYDKGDVLDEFFGNTATDIAKEFKKEFESAIKDGKDPAKVIEELFANNDYSSAFSSLEEQFGITLDNIKAYFTQTGEFVVDPEFDITKYTKAISSHSAIISEFQEALQKLDKGSFTMDDFMGLIEKYPDLAKGVDISSNAFYGLSRNLNKAIKSNTKGFINDLKRLKESLIAAGESTESIDQLIEAVEKMPEDALDGIIEKYGTLADAIYEAKTAQDRLLASMEENPNEGYETRGEAMDYMKAALEAGEVGSGSNVWNVAAQYGFTYDSANTMKENADALAQFIAVRETWFKKDDDGNYTFDGTKNFVEAVESAANNNEELQKILDWNYDETTGSLKFDFDNKNLKTIISLLSETEGLIGLTESEWHDLMIQISQYFDVKFSDYNDAADHLNEIASSAKDAKTKLQEYADYMQEYFGSNTEIDLTVRPMVSGEEMREAGWADFDGDYATVYSGGYSSDDGSVVISATPILPNGDVLDPTSLEKYAKEIANGTAPAEVKIVYTDKETGEERTYTGEDIFLNKFQGPNAQEQEAQYGEMLSEVQAQYDALRDTLGISNTLTEKGIDGLKEIEEIQSAISTNSDGVTVIGQEAFTKALRETGYMEEHINILLEKIKELNAESLLTDSLKIDETLTNKGIDGLQEIANIKNSLVKDDNTGLTVFNTDLFTALLTGAGYAQYQIDELIGKIKSYNEIVATSSSEDPLGLSWVKENAGNTIKIIDGLKASLSTLDVDFKEKNGEFTVDVPDLVSTLRAKGWDKESIQEYMNQLAGLGVEGLDININQEQLDEVLAKIDETPEEKTVDVEIIGTAYEDAKNINDELNKMTDKTVDVTINETTVKTTKVKTETDTGNSGGKSFKEALDDLANGMFGKVKVNGTAHANGSWGAPETETALVGELGPELLVRGNRWTTIGDNGAEFTQVKKGDIIFNHKQTASLLKNGYVTGRGKLHGGAFASGTAYSSTDDMFSKYTFSGEGGYVKYDVNGKELDRFGEAMSEAAGDIEDAADEFKETFDWIEVRIEELDEVLGLLGAQLENATNYSAKNNIIDKIIGTNENKMENLAAGIEKYAQYASTLLSKIPEEYKQAAQDGAIAITEFAGEADEATVEAISNYREWAQKVADLKQQLEEVKTELKELAIQKIDNARESGDVRATVEDSQTEKLQNAVDLIEEKGEIADAAYYEAMMENSNKKIEYLTKSRNAMQKELDDAVASGRIERGSNEWYELVNQMYEVDAAIDEATLELEQFQNAINDIEWENFDQLINRIGYLKDETQSLIDLMDSDDLFTKQTGKDYWGSEDVTWTDEGLATLGLYAQQMEIAEYEARQYGEAIDKLTADYEAGLYSENEYYEKLNELKSAQYDSIEAYEDAKDAIVDLNKARIDHVKEGIEKEIDAYSELIEKKKEALDAEKDLHDFQKSVMDQQKDIADLQRQLDALAYDDSASARAKKAQLQAELAEANEALEETYYDRSISNQQEALDKELEDFQEAKEKEIEELELYLENVEQVVADSLMTVQTNATTVYDTLNAKADEYGLNVSDAITAPWEDGALAVSGYQETFDTAASSTMDQLDAMKNKWQEVIDKMQEASDINVEVINKENANYAKATVKSEPAKTLNSAPPSNAKAAPSVGSTVTVKKSATNFSSNSKNAKMASFVPGGSYTVYEVSGGQVLIGRNGVYTGWVKQTDLEGYAKGTKSASKDQLAILDELGDELQLVPGANGRLEYIKKGTSIIPAKMTERLMDLVIDPQEMLDRNRPQIGAHPEVHNTEIKLDITYGDMVSIGEFHGDNLADLEKMVAKQFEKHTKNLNNSIRKYVR